MTARTCWHTAHRLSPLGVRGRKQFDNGQARWEFCAAATRARKQLAQQLEDAKEPDRA